MPTEKLLKDGYEWIARFDNSILIRIKWIRKVILVYFTPFNGELYNKDLIYRALGIHAFGRFLPTGGIIIRRVTKSTMEAYTLKANSRSGAKEFLYKNCLFELLHLPF
ncbi:hypothetical protein E9993_04965 [Labilibacter sediminis]|nr:hypothetical protein E9993_04965 [Labilibacter sediminis]